MTLGTLHSEPTRALTNSCSVLVSSGRMGEASEVAGLVRYLAIDESALYITGHTFNVDGGMVM